MNKAKRNITTVKAQDIIVSCFDNQFRVIDIERLPNHVSMVVIEIDRGSTYSWRFLTHENVYVKTD